MLFQLYDMHWEMKVWQDCSSWSLCKVNQLFDLVKKEITSLRLKYLSETFLASNSARAAAKLNVLSLLIGENVMMWLVLISQIIIIMMNIKLMQSHIALKFWDYMALTVRQNIGILECWLLGFCFCDVEMLIGKRFLY